ncbi:MAG: peptidoglycan-binding protein [Brasilonema octagenarum HA4186-MV1]|jgi:peptidoglycan hydrolase-like protein with peptidoglycan-binding domain|uniref:Peptidoglycan-binding protein n=1 Tax=Brasilonema sennae CENA114 TaxID=415709 RepID=A0A856MF08_9CYAN|nr:peptidoglycan-binding domain-containing protein [Brasilonema sennae]MBW4627941.1 peptidoglycan-binding protein [Brasilonema octagenarum HA4186-MV1]QDL15084.1 peptidoglycan-binding protein [Brasilonema octagenarum UFV-E1]QDL08728.1 peptidoglycan-binding protein [Brasilonema sennae CENA114]QDL08729.1 peptidoglycan-binding protein [Brasilonema sennae CENA114]QDL15085.1 peptidoglycan-binding protein [Brasilonema octagenarum UFV-E1]
MGMPPTLSRGSTGDFVQGLQRDLSAKGYLDASAVSGTFDEATEEAVKKFQQENGLTVDGVVGPQTGQKLGGPPA